MGKLETDTYFYSIIFLINVQFELKILLGKEATTGRVLSKKVFLKISQNLQENTGARVSFFILFLF